MSCTRSTFSATTTTAIAMALNVCRPTPATLHPAKSKPSPARIRDTATSLYQAKLKTTVVLATELTCHSDDDVMVARAKLLPRSVDVILYDH
jgi:hypothetical protein